MAALYAIPAWLLLALAIVVGAGLAVAGHIAVRRAFRKVDFGAYNDVGGIVLGVVGGLFGVTLAFIIAIVWQEYDGTRQRVAVEAAAATNLWHTARGLPAPLGPQVRRDLVAYAKLMVDDEWPAMRNGGTSPQAETLLTRTFEDVARFRPRDSGAANAQSAALSYLGALHEARHQRLADNGNGVTPFEWTILLIGAIVIVALCYLVGIASFRTQLLMTAAVAGMIAAMFILIFKLDYPFRGQLAVAPAEWQDFMTANRSEV